MPPSRPVTIRDVAREAGVAFTTAAAALRGEERIALMTREKVAAAAASLGYVPNRAASLLASRHAISSAPAPVKLLLVTCAREAAARGDWSPAISHLQQRAAMRGFELASVDLHEQDLDRVLRKAWQCGVDGIILGRFTPPHRIVDATHPFWSKFSIVRRGDDSPGAPFHSPIVRASHVEPMLGIFERLLASGYERPGGVLLRHDPMCTEDGIREAMFRQLQQEKIAPEHRVPLLNRDVHCSITEFAEWYWRYRPDVVVGFPHKVRNWMEQVDPDRPTPIGFITGAAYVPVQYHGRSAGFSFVRYEETLLDVIEQEIRLQRKGFREAFTQTLVPLAFEYGVTLRRPE